MDAERTAATKMHADELDIDVELVHRLLAEQFPEWAELPIAPVPSAGTVNALYRLGDDMVVRLPRVERWALAVEKEHEWLIKLAPQLPLAIPEPLAKGSPGEGYPLRWSVYRWLEGETWATDRIRDLSEAAKDLARFIIALRTIDTADASAMRRPHDTLAARDRYVRQAIAASRGMIDTEALVEAWEAALALPAWDGEGLWVHGDLYRRGNLLVRKARLSAVIDFGGVSIGDPARDVVPAWSLFSDESRHAFCA